MAEGLFAAQIDPEWLRGVKDAAEWAHDNYSDPVDQDIIGAVIAAEVLKQAENPEV